MKREDLEALGLEKEVVDGVMKLHNTDVTEHTKVLNAKDVEISTLNTTVADLTGKVKAFDGVDIEKFKSDITGWETKYNTDVAELKKQNAISLAITKANPKNEKALMALLDTSIIKLNDDGSVTGLSEQLETVKKENGFLFQEEKPNEVDLGGSHGGREEDKPLTLESAINSHYEN